MTILTMLSLPIYEYEMSLHLFRSLKFSMMFIVFFSHCCICLILLLLYLIPACFILLMLAASEGFFGIVHHPVYTETQLISVN